MAGWRPAEQFESETGLTGISRDYVLPADFHDAAENLLGRFGFFAYKIAENSLLVERFSDRISPFFDRTRITKSRYSDTQKAVTEETILFTIDSVKAFNSAAWPLSKLSTDWAKTLHQRLMSLMDKVIEQNLGSGLEHVEVDRNNLLQVRHFFLGLTSGFNPDDIQYYINEAPEFPYNENFDDLYKRGARITRDMPHFEGYMAAVEKVALCHRLGGDIYWSPSPRTLDKIRRDAGLSDWSPDRQELQRAELELLRRHHPRYQRIAYLQTPDGYDERLDL